MIHASMEGKGGSREREMEKRQEGGRERRKRRKESFNGYAYNLDIC